MRHSMPELTGPIAKPASGGAAKQLIVFLHGVGADGNDLIGLSALLSQSFPDAQFTSPNAPFSYDMAPYGYQWFSLQDRNLDRMLEGAQRAEPILNKYLDLQLEILGLTDAQLGIIAFSQGTMMALHTLLRRPSPCAGVVGFSGALIGSEQLANELKARPPICLIHGEQDSVVPFAALNLARDVLTTAGVPVEVHNRPGLGHGIDDGGLDAAVHFLKRSFGL